MLTFAAWLLEADFTLSVDIDPEALSIAQENAIRLGCDKDIQWVCGDLSQPSWLHSSSFIDTVIMNPPFGTKHNAGIDVQFLINAISLAPVVYSLHKSSTRPYIMSKIKQCGAQGEVLAELKFDIPQMYKFHKKSSMDVMVDLIRVSRNK
ncbi:Methyltransferase-like protein 5 [Coelomomyces lativittatus]|nr:Methyltransferase-like protein 5 [Coelomomyces lativittatus]